LDACELLAGVVADAEYDVVGVGQQLERVHPRRLLARGAEPGKHLRASLARDGARRVLPGDVRVEAVGDRVDVAAAQRIDPVEHQLQVGLCLLVVHRLLLQAAKKRNGTANLDPSGRCARTTTEPLCARAQPPTRPAREEEDLPGGGPRSTSG